MKTRLLAIALIVGISGCIRFDNFVFGAIPIKDQNEDLMAKSLIPAALRQEVRITESDGTVLDAYLLTHNDSDGTNATRHGAALLYCHGQNNNIETNVPRTDMLWQLGYSVFVFDYRGFGKSTGSPTDVGVFADTDAAYKWLAANSSHFKIGVYGRSLGTAMCLHGAVDESATALALESPIASIQQIISDSITLATPSDYYVDSKLNNVAEIPNYKGDLLIMHGTEDTYVPPKYGDELHNLAEGHAAENVLWHVPGATHDNVPCTSHATAPQNNCPGGLPDGVSSDWITHVTEFFDVALNL